ncbi:MAG: radical SAM protein [bacterium]
MRIAFVVSEDKNLGVGYLSSYLKKHGHQVHLLFDPRQFAKAYIQNKKLAGYFSKEKYLLRRLQEIKPDLIGFSVVTANYQWGLSLAKKIKEYFDIPIIFGGVHPTLVPERVIRQEAVDMVCIGEAEEAILELAESSDKRTDIRNIYFKRDNAVIANPLRPLEQDLDKYPFPDERLFYELLPSSYRITTSVITSRGCPYSCTYCANHSFVSLYKGQRYVRRRSVDNVLGELKERKERFKTRHFVFMDDVFATDINWLKEFIPRYKKEIGLSFNCLAHPSLVNEDIIGLLKEAGCSTIDFGLQSGSERLRKDILHRFETNEAMVAAAQACRRHGLHFAVDQILNIPTETEGDVLDSAQLLNRIRPDIINCYSLLYFPKAEIILKARELGLLDEKKIEEIEGGRDDGLYSTATLTASKTKSTSFYQRYALLLSSIPLLPKSLCARVISSVKLKKFFSGLPISLMPFVKIIADLKGGLGFIPFSVLANEVFYLKQHFIQQRYLNKK